MVLRKTYKINSERKLKLRSQESSHWIEVADESGLITSIGREEKPHSAVSAITAGITLEISGGERRAPTGGIEYFDTQFLSSVVRTGEPKLDSMRLGSTWVIPVMIGSVPAHIEYVFGAHGPAVSIRLILRHSETIIRNVTLDFKTDLLPGPWTLNIPGNGMRADLNLEQITQSVGVSPLGGLRGSASLVHLSQQNQAIVLWADNDIEIPEVLFEALSPESFKLQIKSNFGSDLSEIDRICLPLVSLDLTPGSFHSFAPVFASWLQDKGINSPNNPPTWIKQAMIFEAQIGFSVFAQVNKYSPYPEVSNLTGDLDRIKKLGFSCIQLMPRQPYPSYNVHDYKNVDVSYGNKEEIKDLVVQAHKRGIKVILDVLLHGILDQEIIKIAADGVRSGPFNDLINSDTSDSFSSDVKDWHNYLIAWSRHIIDFEPYWSGGSPAKTELEESNPEWFYRNSSGDITGVYTKAFDARSDSWKSYFIDSMRYLVLELGIDGFRFDAPTYNDFYNWAPWARYRAGASALACTALFEKMRPIMKGINPELLFYTEPSGLSLRRSMDLNYNYDEQWLVTSIGDASSQKPWGIESGKDLARWIRDRDLLLPLGSMTAHHIDSHDTFWWPSWGKKWRREQFDLSTVRLLTLIFGLLPGPFMMFVGGEEGIEDLLPQISSVKGEEVWRKGKPHWWTSSETPHEVFGLTHTLNHEAVTVLVNTTASQVEFQPEVALGQGKSLFIVGEKSSIGDKVILPPKSGVVVTHSLLKLQ